MKLLYWGHFLEGTGWSTAAINNVIALDKAGVDVVLRNIKVSENEPKEVPELILKNLNKDASNIDCCIQHVLPHFLVKSDLFRNIAFFEAETSTIKHLAWFNELDNMDEIWVPCSHNKNVLVQDGMSEEKIKIIPHTLDISNYSNRENINMSVGTHGYFKFYSITDLNERKNLDSIIRSFHSEFCNGEPVELVLKVTGGNLSQETIKGLMHQKIDRIKDSMRLYRERSSYKQEIVIAGYLSEENMHMLHKACHCFVLPSHGEGFSIPAFEAMAYGNTPICSNDGGPIDFIDSKNKNTGYLINGVYSSCVNNTPAFPELNTAREEWFNPSEREIKKAMRYYFNRREEDKTKDGLEIAKNFSHEAIGKKMLEALNA